MRRIGITSGLRLVLALAVLFFISTLVNVFVSQESNAATKFSGMGLEEKNKSTSYYITLQGCVQNNMYGTIKAGTKNYSPKSISWFDDNNAYGYVYPDGKMDCKDIMATALGLWDISPDSFLKGIGYDQKSGTSYDWTGPGDGGTRKSGFDSYIKNQLGTTDPGNPGQAAAYMRYSYWWDEECVVKKFGKYTDITDSVIKERIDTGFTEKSGTKTVKYVAVNRVGDIPWGYSYNHKAGQATRGGTGSTTFEFIAYGYHNSKRMVSCDDTATSLTKYAGGYQEYTSELAVEQICRNAGYTTITASGTNPVGVYTLGACINGHANADDLLYCNNTYKPKTFTYYGQQVTNSQEAERNACLTGLKITDKDIAAAKEGILAAEQEELGSTGGTGGEGTSCAIEGIGWVVCPLVGFLASVADSSFTFLSDNFLQVDTETVSVNGGTYQAWSIMRTVANVAFVISFLIIIFSQLTGTGIANYGIKKMLPRLVIAAILVNISFFVCQIAVDLSNILGVGLKGVFESIGGGLGSAQYSAGDETNNWVGIATIVLGGTAIVWSLGISVLLPFLIGAVVALVMIFLILVVRQVLIILLVVLSPLAFVAFLLPNTEQYFTKWRKMFVGLLVVFPMIGLLFGASALASDILKDVYGDGEGGNIIGQIVAAGVLVLPLFLLPSMLKGSLSAAGSIGAKLNGLSDRFSKGARSRTANSGLMKNYAAEKAQKRMSISNGTYGGRNPISKLRSRTNKALNNSGAFNTVTGGFGANRTLAGQGQQRKDAQEAMAMFGGDDQLVEAWAASGGDISKVPPHLALNEAQKSQFSLMRNAGHSKKPTSFLAAAQYLSEGGKGSVESLASAMGNASAAGASAAEVGSAWQGAQAAYRKSGRGDIVGEMGAHYAANGNSPALGRAQLAADPMTVTAAREAAWKEVAPEAVHREALKTNEGLNSYITHLNLDVDHTTQALAGYDRMEARAKNIAAPQILAAAQSHQRRSPGGASAPPITTIQEAKAYFNVK